MWLVCIAVSLAVEMFIIANKLFRSDGLISGIYSIIVWVSLVFETIFTELNDQDLNQCDWIAQQHLLQLKSLRRYTAHNWKRSTLLWWPCLVLMQVDCRSHIYFWIKKWDWMFGNWMNAIWIYISENDSWKDHRD